jgi:hypothetical protein
VGQVIRAHREEALAEIGAAMLAAAVCSVGWVEGFADDDVEGKPEVP